MATLNNKAVRLAGAAGIAVVAGLATSEQALAYDVDTDNNTITIENGDTVWGATQYLASKGIATVSVDGLAQLNDLKDAGKVRAGTVLKFAEEVAPVAEAEVEAEAEVAATPAAEVEAEVQTAETELKLPEAVSVIPQWRPADVEVAVETDAAVEAQAEEAAVTVAKEDIQIADAGTGWSSYLPSFISNLWGTNTAEANVEVKAEAAAEVEAPAADAAAEIESTAAVAAEEASEIAQSTPVNPEALMSTPEKAPAAGEAEAKQCKVEVKNAEGCAETEAEIDKQIAELQIILAAAQKKLADLKELQAKRAEDCNCEAKEEAPAVEEPPKEEVQTEKPAEKPTEFTLERGDNLCSLFAGTGYSVTSVAGINGYKDPNKVNPGTYKVEGAKQVAVGKECDVAAPVVVKKAPPKATTKPHGKTPTGTKSKPPATGGFNKMCKAVPQKLLFGGTSFKVAPISYKFEEACCSYAGTKQYVMVDGKLKQVRVWGGSECRQPGGGTESSNGGGGSPGGDGCGGCGGGGEAGTGPGAGPGDSPGNGPGNSPF
ncbi:MAG: hypothetical protein WC989_06395 [Micavibrio sp.]